MKIFLGCVCVGGGEVSTGNRVPSLRTALPNCVLFYVWQTPYEIPKLKSGTAYNYAPLGETKQSICSKLNLIGKILVTAHAELSLSNLRKIYIIMSQPFLVFDTKSFFTPWGSKVRTRSKFWIGVIRFCRECILRCSYVKFLLRQIERKIENIKKHVKLWKTWT